jgi:sporulation protein YlmC with PRC-barrel domain
MCGWNLKFSELAKMVVYGKGMKRIGEVVDLEVDLQSRLVEDLIVKVQGVEAKKAWKGRLHVRSPKISIPTDFITSVRDAIQLQYTLEEMKDKVKKV